MSMSQPPGFEVANTAHSIISKINSAFALKQLGELDYFGGIEVKHLLLSQAKYIRDLLEKAGTSTLQQKEYPLYQED
ncbi:hypothetical protein CR513_13052, partial [Mucuna pruriens]